MSALDQCSRSSSAEQAIQIVTIQPRLQRSPERERLERRAGRLAWGGIAYHFIEFAIALAAGIAAGSIALIGFGADSLIEALAGFVVLWLFTGARIGSEGAERRAQQLIAASFFFLAAYVGVESVRTLAGGDHPEASWVGIGLAAFTTVTMPLLGRTSSVGSGTSSGRQPQSRRPRRPSSAPTFQSRSSSDSPSTLPPAAGGQTPAPRSSSLLWP